MGRAGPPGRRRRTGAPGGAGGPAPARLLVEPGEVGEMPPPPFRKPYFPRGLELPAGAEGGEEPSEFPGQDIMRSFRIELVTLRPETIFQFLSRIGQAGFPLRVGWVKEGCPFCLLKEFRPGSDPCSCAGALGRDGPAHP